MKIEIRSHFWPATPDVREIKIVIDGKVIQSEFMTPDEIWCLAKSFRELDDDLMDIGYKLHEDIVNR